MMYAIAELRAINWRKLANLMRRLKPVMGSIDFHWWRAAAGDPSAVLAQPMHKTV